RFFCTRSEASVQRLLCVFAVVTILLVLSIFSLALVVAGLLGQVSPFPRPPFSVGAPIIYRQDQASTRPSSAAHDVRPSPRGEFYYYTVINYLRVIEVLDDQRIVAVARNNQRLCLS